MNTANTASATTAAFTSTMKSGAKSRAGQDVELIQRIATGDNSAMATLFRRHHLGVFRFMMRIVADEGIAEDLTSEVFLEVWRQSGRFESRSAVSTWILAIARYKAFAARRFRNEQKIDDVEMETIEDAADNAETIVHKNGRGDVLRRCLEALSVEHREVIDLVYYHEMSVEEAANVLRIPRNTVKTRMFYARRQLSGLLGNAGVDRHAL